jgi:hypothetical protein
MEEVLLPHYNVSIGGNVPAKIVNKSGNTFTTGDGVK